ncbi:hypothetical protein GCM10009525_79430 [Streptosporangium amethystogenes subsp. fukuiense]
MPAPMRNMTRLAPTLPRSRRIPGGSIQAAENLPAVVAVGQRRVHARQQGVDGGVLGLHRLQQGETVRPTGQLVPHDGPERDVLGGVVHP